MSTMIYDTFGFKLKSSKNAGIVLLISAAVARVAWVQAMAPRTAGSCNKLESNTLDSTKS